ncbi:MAG: NUDIX domain-containing protein, partial [bacterium]|nr:NUDIX domain-containing protein [bacterium]
MTNSISIYAAGSAMDTPGQAGIGLIIVSPSGLVREFSENIGIATEDQAILQAIVRALKLVSDRRNADIIIYLKNADLAGKLKRNTEITDEYLRGLWLQIQKSSENLHIAYEFSQSVNIGRAEELASKASLEDPEKNTNPNAIRHAIQQSAGGVVYKKDKGLTKVCLIAKKDGEIWALPKGRVRSGETWEKAAIREILEETGH